MIRTLAITIAALLSSLAANGDDRQDVIAKLAEARRTRKADFESQHKAAMEKVSAAEKEYKRQVSRGYTKAQVQPQLEEVEKLKKASSRIKVYLDGCDTWIPYLNPKAMAKGDWGTFTAFGSAPGARIVQIIDGNTALVSMYRGDLYWAELDTKGLVDDKLVEIDGLILCTGPKKYNSVGGSEKTVMGFKFLGKP